MNKKLSLVALVALNTSGFAETAMMDQNDGSGAVPLAVPPSDPNANGASDALTKIQADIAATTLDIQAKQALIQKITADIAQKNAKLASITSTLVKNKMALSISESESQLANAKSELSRLDQALSMQNDLLSKTQKIQEDQLLKDQENARIADAKAQAEQAKNNQLAALQASQQQATDLAEKAKIQAQTIRVVEKDNENKMLEISQKALESQALQAQSEVNETATTKLAQENDTTRSNLAEVRRAAKVMTLEAMKAALGITDLSVKGAQGVLKAMTKFKSFLKPKSSAIAPVQVPGSSPTLAPVMQQPSVTQVPQPMVAAPGVEVLDPNSVEVPVTAEEDGKDWGVDTNLGTVSNASMSSVGSSVGLDSDASVASSTSKQKNSMTRAAKVAPTGSSVLVNRSGWNPSTNVKGSAWNQIK